MGSSFWEYYVAYQADFTKALDELRAKTLREGQFNWHGRWAAGGDGLPITETELWRDEFTKDNGTHSILDVFRVIGPKDLDAFGTVRPLTEAEVLRYLGGPRPSRSMLERAVRSGSTGAPPDILSTPSWSGNCTVLYSDAGEPVEIGFWGFSGD